MKIPQTVLNFTVETIMMKVTFSILVQAVLKGQSLKQLSSDSYAEESFSLDSAAQLGNFFLH